MTRILICDDSQYMRGVIRGILEEKGYEIVAEAEDADEAVEKYKKFRPDLVTMDMLMRKSGSDAVADIMKINKNAKVVIVSVLNDGEELVVSAIKAGALGIVTKPIKKEVLLNEVERVLKK
jgi:two-component system chemotaxis response regulator CheY